MVADEFLVDVFDLLMDNVVQHTKGSVDIFVEQDQRDFVTIRIEDYGPVQRWASPPAESISSATSCSVRYGTSLT